MMVEDDLFLNQLQALFKEQNPQESLHKLRMKGWDHFLELGLPTKKTEVFQYVRLRKIFEKSFQRPASYKVSDEDILPYILPECKRSFAVFVNGSLDLTKSKLDGLGKKVVLIPLEEALRSFGAFINNQVIKSLQEEVDPFAALNSGFIQKAFFVYVPPNTVLDAPLQIIHFIKGEKQLICPRVELFFGALSEAKIIETVVQDESSLNLLNGVNQFVLEEGAQVSFSRIQKRSAEMYQFSSIRAVLKKDSSFKSVLFDEGQTCFRDDYKVYLMGNNANVSLNGVKMLQGNRESHTHVLIEHKAPYCKSSQLFKGVLSDSSRSSFEGKIYVHPIAQKTEAFQMSQHLLLSDGAEVDSKPNLEIFADDVKASHGATIGQLNEEELFYLQTRGISLQSAKSLLTQGFCHEIIHLFDSPELVSLASEAAKTYLV